MGGIASLPLGPTLMTCIHHMHVTHLFPRTGTRVYDVMFIRPWPAQSVYVSGVNPTNIRSLQCFYIHVYRPQTGQAVAPGGDVTSEPLADESAGGSPQLHRKVHCSGCTELKQVRMMTI